MSTARSSDSVRLMAYESLDPEEKEYHRIMYEKCLTDQELEHISNAYEAVYPNNRIIHNSRFCKEFKTLVINGVEYISEKSRFQRSPIFAHWPSLQEILTLQVTHRTKLEMCCRFFVIW